MSFMKKKLNDVETRVDFIEEKQKNQNNGGEEGPDL